MFAEGEDKLKLLVIKQGLSQKGKEGLVLLELIHISLGLGLTASIYKKFYNMDTALLEDL